MEKMPLLSTDTGVATCLLVLCSVPKATLSMVLSVIGFVVAVTIGFLGQKDMLEYAMYGLGVLFAALCVISYMYRSLEKQLHVFAKQNDELEATKNAFDQENEELKESRRQLDAENAELRETRKLLDRENEELKSTRLKLDAENKELANSVVSINRTKEELAAENIDLASNVKALEDERMALQTQVANLNKLHNEGVVMIRQLALYGDSCKHFGKDLKDVADNLHQTDDSLGLTAEELDKKIAALGQVVKTLERVSVD